MSGSAWIYDEQLPSDLSILGVLYPVLQQWASDGGLGHRLGHRAIVSVTEAVTNAIIHAHAAKPHELIQVRLGDFGDSLVAEVVDQGDWDGTICNVPSLSSIR